MSAFSTRLGFAGQRTFRATVTGFEGTITAAAVIAEATRIAPLSITGDRSRC